MSSRTTLVILGSCHLVLLLSFCACIVVLRGGLRPPLFIMGLLAGDDPCHLMLLLSLQACTAVLRGGLRPPLFIMSLLVGDDPCYLMLLLSFCACIVVLRGGLRPPLFIISLLVGDDSCHLMLLFGPPAVCGRPVAGRLLAATGRRPAGPQPVGDHLKQKCLLSLL